jgi:hypothetical protein
MPDRRSDWLITCGCGWTRELSQRWAGESAAKLHPKLAAPGTEHTITIERPLRAARGPPGPWRRDGVEPRLHVERSSVGR